MKQTPSDGAWVVLLDDDEELRDRLVAVLATEREAQDFVSEVADQFNGSLEYGFYRFGWRFDTQSGGYSAT